MTMTFHAWLRTRGEDPDRLLAPGLPAATFAAQHAGADYPDARWSQLWDSHCDRYPNARYPRLPEEPAPVNPRARTKAEEAIVDIIHGFMTPHSLSAVTGMGVDRATEIFELARVLGTLAPPSGPAGYGATGTATLAEVKPDAE